MNSERVNVIELGFHIRLLIEISYSMLRRGSFIGSAMYAQLSSLKSALERTYIKGSSSRCANLVL